MNQVPEYSGTSNYVIYQPGNKECPSIEQKINNNNCRAYDLITWYQND